MTFSIKNTLELRKANTKLVINRFRQQPFETKKGIAESLNLSFATASNICNYLLERNIIETDKMLESEGGRVPTAFRIKNDSWLSIGIDLTVSGHVSVGAINLKNDIIFTRKVLYDKKSDINAILNMVRNVVEEVKHKYPVSIIPGIGVAIPGIYDKKSGKVLNSTIPLFEEVELKEEAGKIFGFNCHIENESNLLAKAAQQINHGRGESNSDLIYIFVGEGLGVGIISNDRLLTGSRGMGAEIGHMPLGDRKFKCGCGNEGCIEQELSFKGFLRYFYGEREEFTQEDWVRFVCEVKAGNKRALEVVEHEGMLLGKVISILANIFDPSIVYIGGIIDDIYDYIYPFANSEMKKRTLMNNYRNIEIARTIDKNNLIFIGCNQLVFENWDID